MEDESSAVIVALLIPPIVFFAALAGILELATGEISSAYARFKRAQRLRRRVKEVQPRRFA